MEYPSQDELGGHLLAMHDVTEIWAEKNLSNWAREQMWRAKKKIIQAKHWK